MTILGLTDAAYSLVTASLRSMYPHQNHQFHPPPPQPPPLHHPLHPPNQMRLMNHQNHHFHPYPPKRTRLMNNVSNDFAVISQFLEEFNSVITSQQQMPKQQSPVDDFMGPEFDRAKINVRHESEIRALYSDISRQCKTCGTRFMSEEKHRDHMDWHFRKNRNAKKYNNSSKRKLSRCLFPSSSLWLRDLESNGKPTAPTAFWAADHAIEKNKKQEELFDVPADENQEECPLCMERFEFYMSDDTNDWMYKGTVYLSEAKASSRKFYKSLLGRIVHVKCIND